MANETRQTQARSEESHRSHVDSPEAMELDDDLGQGMRDPMDAAAMDSAQAQSALLSDQRRGVLQRQRLATQIGHVQGNRHLQRVIKAVGKSVPMVAVQRYSPEERASYLAQARRNLAGIEAQLAETGPMSEGHHRLLVDRRVANFTIWVLTRWEQMRRNGLARQIFFREPAPREDPNLYFTTLYRRYSQAFVQMSTECAGWIGTATGYTTCRRLFIQLWTMSRQLGFPPGFPGYAVELREKRQSFEGAGIRIGQLQDQFGIPRTGGP